MTTMVEKVAKAILDEIREGGAFVNTNDDDLRYLVLVDGDVDMLAVARAAIEAMKEPTEAMVMSQGKSKPENAATETQRERAEALNRSVRRLAVETWREMIQAALKEGQ